VPGAQSSETFRLCRSADRREKEKATHERFAGRIEARLERSRKPLEREPIDRQIGRILGQNTRAAGRYQICVVDDAERASKLRREPHEPKPCRPRRCSSWDS